MNNKVCKYSWDTFKINEKENVMSIIIFTTVFNKKIDMKNSQNDKKQKWSNTELCSVLSGGELRIRWLGIPCSWVRPDSPKRGVLCMTLNCIWWWDYSTPTLFFTFYSIYLYFIYCILFLVWYNKFLCLLVQIGAWEHMRIQQHVYLCCCVNVYICMWKITTGVCIGVTYSYIPMWS